MERFIRPVCSGAIIRQCAGDKLGRLRRLALAWKPRSDTKAHQPALAGDRVYQHIGRLDVLVDKTELFFERRFVLEPFRFFGVERCTAGESTRT